MKIAIIGAGMVGSQSAFLLAYENIGDEIVLTDIDANRAKAEALDIAQSLVLCGNINVLGGHIEDIKESDIVVITAGAKQKVGEKRSELLVRNQIIMEDIAEKIKNYAPNAVVLVATNPMDEMTEVVKNKLLGTNLVLGTGTEIDSYRFRYYLGKFLRVEPAFIFANVIGFHNEFAKFLWDDVYVGSLKLADFLQKNNIILDDEAKTLIEQKVINSAFEIIKGKGATYFAIAVVIKEFVFSLARRRGVEGMEWSRGVEGSV